VRINPSLPTWISDYVPNYEPDLLGLAAVDKTWTLNRVGEFGFIVDVLVIKDVKMVNEESGPAVFSRFGTGVVNDVPIRPRLGQGSKKTSRLDS